MSLCLAITAALTIYFCVNYSYFVGPNPIKPSAIEVKASEPTSKPSMEKKMTDAMLDLQIEYLGKIADSESGIPSFDKRWQNLTSQYPDNLSLCVAKLKYLDGRPERMELLPDIVLASKAVISLISEESLAQGLGRNVDSENGNSVQVRLLVFLFHVCFFY